MKANQYLQKKIQECPFCAEQTKIRKHGLARSKIQRYRCTSCEKTFQARYIYKPRTEQPMLTC